MENAHGKSNKVFGLLGKNISYSFSKGYFTQKFKDLSLENHIYRNFDIQSMDQFQKELDRFPELKGLNVTIPYKEDILPFLDELSPLAKAIGAVNTIEFSKEGKRIGHNTDFYGFRDSLAPLIKEHHKNALLLGTGGASKAIAHVFETLAIPFKFVSRTKKQGQFTYEELDQSVIEDHQIIVNCTPLGTYPAVEAYPNIPYQHLSKDHLLYDLIYNPKETRFLKEGKEKGATIVNGQRMLELQAEKSWEIWNGS